MPTRERIIEIVVNVTRMATKLGLAAVVVGSLLATFASAGHYFDILASFRNWYVGASLLAVPVLWASHSPKAALVAVALAAFNAVYLVPWMPHPNVGNKPCERGAEVLVINAWISNEQPQDILDLIDERQPEMVVISELSVDLAEKMSTRFPHVFATGRDHPSGIGLYSQFPIEDARFLGSRRYHSPQIDARVATPDGTIRVLGVHPVAPGNPRASADRNEVIEMLAQIVRTSEVPVLLAGDLNITMWSPNYSPLEEAGLINARRGRGVQGTWPAALPTRIPIDHVMHSRELSLCGFEVERDISSDHLPLVARIGWSSNQTAIASRSPR